MTRRIIAGTAALLAMVVGAAGCSSGGILNSGGPVEFHDGSGTDTVSSLSATPGQEVVFGYNVIVNTGDEPVVLDSAAPDGDVDNAVAELTQAYVIDTGESNNDIIGAAYRRSEPLMKFAQPLVDYTLEPDQPVAVVLAFKVNDTAEQLWPGIVVHYTTDDGKGYEITSTSGIAINSDDY